MSKVKHLPEDICIPMKKEKIRRTLRRIENEHIKKKRMALSKMYGYGYRYYVKDSIIIRSRETMDVPEQEIPIYHWEILEKESGNKCGRIHVESSFVRVLDGYRVIPAHTVTYSRTVKEVPRKPYLKEHSWRKKWLKRQAARRVRNTSPYQLYNNCEYKRLYDLWMMLW